MSGAEVVVSDVSKAFEGGRITALANASLRLAPGELVALTGPSGSGKSTLLNLIGALDRPDAGTISVDGFELDAVDATAYRAETVGFVFQFHHLIPTVSALDNVQVPMLGRSLGRLAREEKARTLLAEVGLAARAHAVPGILSGGERQRVAIARALGNDPRLLLADEPTGSLDSETGAQVLALLQRLRAERGMTVLLVTNDDDVAASADRTLRLLDGRLTPDEALRSASA
ncbi:MAG: ABC transporter ATP-binding protein [Actinobacteria bacterium]|nr:MAG: ABC transporter ATP-binding protein [Actinomycetota bacterium]